MPPVVAFHMATALMAVPLGAWLLLGTKGTAAHRLGGRIWALLMLATAISSFGITGIAGARYSFLHILAGAAILGILAAVWHARRGNIARHRRAVAAVYISLIITLAWAAMPGRSLGNLLWA